MVKSRSKFPVEGEFVVGKIMQIENQYVYVDLIDYEGLPSEMFAKGFIHVSEISSRWIKNIRNYVRIGQRVVLRVLRVDPQKGQVDLSLRRVNSAQRENRLKQWKYAVKFENILQFLTEEEGVNLTLDEVYNLIGWPLLERFQSYQETLDSLKENGEEIVETLEGFSDDIKKKFLTIIDENVKISTVSISGKIKLSFPTENGIDNIKESLIEAKSIIESKETRSIYINYIAAPFYRLEVVSKDYLDAENILSDALEIIDHKAKEYKGSFEFIRD